MIEHSILIDKLKDFDYYKNKLPLFLQNSYGFIEKYRIWYELLIGSKLNYDNGIVPSADRILQLLDIFNENYLSFIQELDSLTDDNSISILDMLAQLFNCRRSFEVSYTYGGSQITKQLILDDKDLLIYTRAQIIRQWFNGTYEDLLEQYASSGLNILQLTDTSSIAASNLYLVYSAETVDDEYSKNVQDMFLAGLLTIDSVGIRYNYSIQQLANFLIWDGNFLDNSWDNGVWAI